jgi:hypothetical protein
VDFPGSESFGKLVEIGKSDDGNSWVSIPFITYVFFQNLNTKWRRNPTEPLHLGNSNCERLRI